MWRTAAIYYRSESSKYKIRIVLFSNIKLGLWCGLFLLNKGNEVVRDTVYENISNYFDLICEFFTFKVSNL